MTCPGRNSPRQRLMSRRQTSGELDGMPIDPTAVAANGAAGIPSMTGSEAVGLSIATLRSFK
jgi:hypothetical protein